jgi:conjugal transfer/type IV secretion protein DotA/TraY
MPITIPTSPDLPPTDLSNIAFSKLFGENWWQVTERFGDTFTGPIIPILGTMNMLLFSFVTGFALYSLVTGSVGAASTGKIGGGKLNSFWWPLRLSFGLSMTFPMTVSGLSVFQVLILGCLGWACTFANSVYTASIDHLAKSNFMVLQADAPPGVQENARECADLIFEATFTQAYVMKYHADLSEDLKKRGSSSQFKPWSESKTYAKDELVKGADHPKWTLAFSTPPGLHPFDLGGFTISGERGEGTTGGNDPLMVAQRNGLLKMTDIIYPVTQAIVNGQAVAPGWRERAISAYTAQVMPVYARFTDYYPEHDINKDAEAFKKEARELGWMAAGAMPLRMSSMSAEMLEKINQRVQTISPRTYKLRMLYDGEKYKEYTTATVSAMSVSASEVDTNALGTSIEDAVNMGDPGGAIDRIMDFIAGRKGLAALLSRLEHEDPALVFGQFGHVTANTGIAVWTAGLGLSFKKGLMKGWSDSAWGKAAGILSGGAVQAGQGGASAVAQYIIGWIYVLCAGLFIVGLLFAYVIPVIPTLYWILAMAGFLVLVVEVLVAAPFWAAAHAWSTEDQGLAGEMGRKGYFQLLEVLFRPALYIMGFIAIFLILRVVGWLTARLFEAFYASYASADFGLAAVSTTGLVTSVVMMVILGGLYLYLFMFLCSEGYSHLPRKVMSWLGHNNTSSMGIAAGAEAMRQVIVGGIGRGTRSRKSPSMIPKETNGQGGKGGGAGGGSETPQETPPMENTGGEQSGPRLKKP